MLRLKNKLDSITVPQENPFAYDALNRKPLVDLLANRIAKSETPYVLAVNGPWGSGKTVLIQMLVAHLRQQNFISIHFNAWEHDHGENALAAMVCSLDKQLGKKSGAAKPLKKAAKSLGVGIVKLMASHAGIAPLVEALLSQKASMKWSPLKSHEDYLTALKTFKEELAKIGTAGTPLVFFVDELDRCRPDFAVEVLEKIKHVFDARNVFFVVSLNKDALAMTIRNVYGHDEGEADKYLRRFFDGEFIIPQGDITATLVERIGFPAYFQRRRKDLEQRRKQPDKWANIEENDLPKVFSLLFRAWSVFISLRDQEQIVSSLAQAARCINPAISYISARLMIYFALLKFRDRGLYDETKAVLGKFNEYGQKTNAAFPFQKHLDLLDEVMSSGAIPLETDRENQDLLYRVQVDMAILAYKNCPNQQKLIEEWGGKWKFDISNLVNHHEFHGRGLVSDLLFYFNKIDGIDPDIYNDELEKDS